MDVRLLGPFEVLADDGTSIEVGGPRARAVLALLALSVGEAVAAERIIELVWGDDELRDRTNALQALVSKIRRAWGAAGAGEGAAGRGPCPVVTRGRRYVLDVVPEAVDAVRFERLVGMGRARSDVGDVTAAARHLSEALSLWRGTALAGFEDRRFAEGDRARLESLRLAAHEARCDAELALGRHEMAVGELQSLVVAHPLRERFRAQLMLALYRSARQGDALRAYEAARVTLAEELGIDPGPELRQLESAILDQSPSLDLAPVQTSGSGSASALAPRPAAVVPVAGPERSGGNLPAPISSFVGRSAELARVGELLSTHRLVTLAGPGGVGKTRLAIEAARRLGATVADGTWLVELAGVAAPARPGAVGAVRAAVAGTLGLDDSDGLHDFLAERTALLVVDNCEHLVADVAAVIQAVLVAAPGLRVLATSRERLGVAGEVLFAVPPMASRDAVSLFTERSEAAGVDVDDEDSDVLARICDQLDGLPLAVELAAARTRSLSLVDISARIGDRFTLLTGGDRTAARRQQTLRGVVDWSYELLFGAEQAVFRRLGVFTGGFGVEAAGAVCAADGLHPDDVAELVAHLVDKSLVTVLSRRGPTRYGLLQTLVDYGRERLAAEGEEEATLDRLVTWAAGFAAGLTPGLRGPDQLAWLGTIAAERANLVTAFEHAERRGRADDALTIASGIAYGWYVLGDAAEAVPVLRRALALPGDDSPAHRARRASSLMWAGALGRQHGSGPAGEAADQMEAALALARETSPPVFWTAAVFRAGMLADDGDVDAAVALLDEADALLAVTPDRWNKAGVDWARAQLMLRRHAVDTAATLLRRAIAGFDAGGDGLAKALCMPLLGELAERRGDLDEAVAATEAAYATVTAAGAAGFLAPQLAVRLGDLAALRGRFDEATSWHEGALDAARAGRFLQVEAQALTGMGTAARWQGRAADAERCHRQASEAYATLEAPGGLALSDAHLGALAAERGDLDGAEVLLRRSLVGLVGLDSATGSGDRKASALAVEGLCAVRSRRGDHGAATTLLAMADALRDSGGGRRAPGDRPALERVERTARAMLDEDTYAAAVHLGSTEVDRLLTGLAAGGDLPAA